MNYLNENDIPELVAGPHGLVSIYSFEAGGEEHSMSGTLHTVMDQWGYGGGGNYGSVVSRKNCLEIMEKLYQYYLTYCE